MGKGGKGGGGGHGKDYDKNSESNFPKKMRDGQGDYDHSKTRELGEDEE